MPKNVQKSKERCRKILQETSTKFSENDTVSQRVESAQFKKLKTEKKNRHLVLPLRNPQKWGSVGGYFAERIGGWKRKKKQNMPVLGLEFDFWILRLSFNINCFETIKLNNCSWNNQRCTSYLNKNAVIFSWGASIILTFLADI